MTGGDNVNVAIADAIGPDGGWGWMIVFSSFMIHFIMDGITYAMAEIYLEPMLTALKLDRGHVSAIFSNLPAITLFSGPIATVFTNMYGCRIVTIVGACLASLGFFLSRWWENIYYYYITIGLMGGFGLIYAPAIISVAYYFDRKRSLAMGIAVCASGFGTVIFPPLMHWMIKTLFRREYKPALLVESGIILTCVIFGALMLPLPQEKAERRREEIKTRKQAKRQAASVTQNLANTELQQQAPLLAGRQLVDSARAGKTNTAVSASSNANQQKPPVALQSKPDDPTQSDDENEEEDEHLASRASPAVIRKDAMYQGSLENIPLYKENIEEYHRKIITPLEVTDQPASSTAAATNVDHIKVKGFFGELKAEVGIKFLADGAFLLFTISNFLTSLGFNVPYNFAHDLAKDAHVVEHQREYVIMSIGLSNAIGRIIIGYLGDHKKINRLYLYNSTLILAGIATILAPYCRSNVIPHIAYASVFGFFSGGYVGLTSIIITDLVGIHNLSSAFGIILLFQGIAVAIGTPVTGIMRDSFAKHARPFLWPYFTFGSFIVLSGIILFGIPTLKRRQQRCRKLTKTELDMGVVSYADKNPSSPEQQK
ncbi:unnamed protein product [Rotaria sp. Silwood2]|nr:unnamed protein product [Rotaria sp. Silwood2]CAF3007179.1 unnamed protein product [Rotaria sp. Silwood2]CAF3369239.1 unnamed protein product [Rotaria sp. Silwood2]CAF4151338.1 unnamed protein product [Rotaria sp. Silwood2]CAF4279280.1 unnamed protein product [Rotaria sp. Silwood2]